jgi:hypothetical protein
MEASKLLGDYLLGKFRPSREQLDLMWETKDRFMCLLENGKRLQDAKESMEPAAFRAAVTEWEAERSDLFGQIAAALDTPPLS